MSLSAGTRVGAYVIDAPIGAGGMGEVYRARDAALQRDVAIKILPELFADDLERLARFSREAQTLAALNHPNIAQIYGLEGAALVMELVDGEDLAQQLSRGPIPLEDALPLARQIAEALEAAHARGIVHRDLKPANIKVRPDGTVKVLDFGLAKAFETTGSASASDANSPTVLGPTFSSGISQMGMILGTAAYMAPEQAKGRAVDKRADIWAFGCVLFEMLTGKIAFAGDGVTEILAAVMRDEPDWSGMPGDTPDPVRRLLRRCLTKDPRERLSDIGVARLEIRDAMDRSQSASQPQPSRTRPGIVGARWVAPAALLVGALATALGAWLLRPVPRVFPRLSLTIDWPEGLTWGGLAGTGVAISPDGTRLAFQGVTTTEERRLYIHALSDGSTRAVPGSEQGYGPFFSPDSSQLGFVLSGKLWRAPVDGGTSFEIGSIDSNDRGWAWSADGYVYSGGGAGISRIAETGGTRESLTSVDRNAGEVAHRFPAVVPGRGILFTIFKGGLEESRIAVFDLKTRKWRVLMDRQGHSAQYLSTGQMVYLRAGVMMIVPFDTSRLEVTGPPTPVMNGVAFNNGGAGHFAVAETGTLVYVPDEGLRTPAALMWADRTGKITPIDVPRDAYLNPAISPEGSRVALERQDSPSKSSIVIWNFGRRALTQVTRDSGQNERPIWVPGGDSLIFTSRPQFGSMGRLFRLRADGAENPVQISKAVLEQQGGSAAESAGSISSDGTKVFYEEFLTSSSGIKALDLATSRTEVLVPPRVYDPRISPDGRWLAYGSQESGISEIYLRPYPDVNNTRWTVSNLGGRSPRWSRDGREMFYNGIGVNQTKIFVVRVESGATMGTVRPQVLFEIREPLAGFDVAPDGRFLLLTADPAKRPIPHVIVNWFEALKRAGANQRTPE